MKLVWLIIKTCITCFTTCITCITTCITSITTCITNTTCITCFINTPCITSKISITVDQAFQLISRCFVTKLNERETGFGTTFQRKMLRQTSVLVF